MISRERACVRVRACVLVCTCLFTELSQHMRQLRLRKRTCLVRVQTCLQKTIGIDRSSIRLLVRLAQQLKVSK